MDCVSSQQLPPARSPSSQPLPPTASPSSSPLSEAVPLSEKSNSPPVNKQKLIDGEDGDVGINNSTSFIQDEPEDIITYDSEEDYENIDKAVLDKYYQQLDESEGFDIKDFPGSCWMVTVYPLPYYLKNPKNYDMLKDYAGRALKQYNDSNGTSHEVEDVLKVNGGGCRNYHYYITFTVKTHDGNLEYFQAKVVEHQNYHLDFPIVRPRAKKDLDI